MEPEAPDVPPSPGLLACSQGVGRVCDVCFTPKADIKRL